MWEKEQAMAVAAPWTPGKPLRRLWETIAACLSRVRITRKSHALRLEETLALGERRMLAIVEWKGEKLLIGVTPQQITLLEPRNFPQAVASRAFEVTGQ